MSINNQQIRFFCNKCEWSSDEKSCPTHYFHDAGIIKQPSINNNWEEPKKNGLIGEFKGFITTTPITLAEILNDLKEGKIELQTAYDMIKEREGRTLSSQQDAMVKVAEGMKIKVDGRTVKMPHLEEEETYANTYNQACSDFIKAIKGN